MLFHLLGGRKLFYFTLEAANADIQKWSEILGLHGAKVLLKSSAYVLSIYNGDRKGMGPGK